MKDKVLKYFDTYFGGELNESTTDEQLDQAAMDLVDLTEAVLDEFIKRPAFTTLKGWGIKRKPNPRKRAKEFIKSVQSEPAGKHVQRYHAHRTILKNIDPEMHVQQKYKKDTPSGKTVPSHTEITDKKKYDQAHKNREALKKTEAGRKLIADVTPKKLLHLKHKESMGMKYIDGDYDKDMGKKLGKHHLRRVIKPRNAGEQIHMDLKSKPVRYPADLKTEPEGDTTKTVLKKKPETQYKYIGKPGHRGVFENNDNGRERRDVEKREREREDEYPAGLEFKALDKAVSPTKWYSSGLKMLQKKHPGREIQPSLASGSRKFGGKEPEPIVKGGVTKETKKAAKEVQAVADAIKNLRQSRGHKARKEREQQGQMSLFK